ncbi:MAG: class I SAM-dependent methyltransferase [Deltaproteobacteria bacterium]|nr:class I SAM-dependent methyltransferase [Deltaproteobacteria bacterium]
MRSLTEAVRAQYERFPYPSTTPHRPGLGAIRFDAFPHVTLSYVERRAQGGDQARRLRVLDAGCGTGACLQALASLHPGIDVVGVDMNRTALARLRESSAHLANLRVVEADLHDVARACEGPFDVILLSGVLHHTAEPDRVLAGLASLLAEDGVMTIMVYARWGRDAVTRMRTAIHACLSRGPDGLPDVAEARRFVSAVREGPATRPPFDDGAVIDDVELVDRYLNVHEETYDVARLFRALERAGLAFLRWLEPAEWSLGSVLSDPGLVRELEARLDEEGRAKLVERLGDRPALVLHAVRRGARARALVVDDDLRVALSPLVSQELDVRVHGGREHVESLSLRVRNRPSVAASAIEAALLALVVEGPRTVGELRAEMERLHGAGADVARVIDDLLQREVLYAPWRA